MKKYFIYILVIVIFIGIIIFGLFFSQNYVLKNVIGTTNENDRRITEVDSSQEEFSEMAMAEANAQNTKRRIVDENEEEKPIVVELEKKEDIVVNMSVIGDIMCHNTQYMDAYSEATKTYDFSYVFENIKESHSVNH